MRKIKANKQDLLDQFELNFMEMSSYLDLETGQVIAICAADQLEEDAELCKLIDEECDRFLVLPKQDSRCDFNEMVRFSDQVTDKQLQEKLEIALNGRGAFRRFRDVLFDYPQEREAWFAFSNERKCQRLKRWLDANEIEIIDTAE